MSAFDHLPGREPERQPFESLLSRFLNVAAAVARRLPGPVARELIDDASSLFYATAARYEPAVAPFEAWAKVVLYHRGIDLIRRDKREVSGLSDWGSLPARGPSAGPDLLAAEAERLREELARLSGPLGGSKVRYRLFLKLFLRLRVAARAVRAYRRGVTPPAGELASIAERLLPWGPGEEGERFVAHAAPAGECWRAVVPLLGGGAAPTAEAVCAAIPASPPLRPSDWGTWAHRARGLAREAMAGRWDGSALAALLGPAGGEGP